MIKTLILLPAVALLFLCSCATLNPVYVGPNSPVGAKDLCKLPNVAVNLKKYLNQKIGKQDGPSKQVEAIVNLSADSKTEKTFINHPNGEEIVCYGKLQYLDGSSQAGIFDLKRIDRNGSFDAFWTSDIDLTHIKSDREMAAEKRADTLGRCLRESYVYELAADARDQGRSPQEALNVVRNSFPPEKLPFLKAVINEIYFDSTFANARGEAFRNQMMDLCVNGPKQWEPLK